MFIAIAALAISFGAGVGVGRIKNKAKLSAVAAELAKVEASAVAEVKSLAATIKSKL